MNSCHTRRASGSRQKNQGVQKHLQGVKALPWVTGSIGRPDWWVLDAVEGQRPEMGGQKDDEEQDQCLRPTSPVMDAQPSTGGMAPEAPPITMFCGVLG